MGAPKTHNRFTAPTSLPTGQARVSSNRCLTMNRRAYSALAEEEILGLKPRTPREPRLDSKQQLSQNATIGLFITIRPPARHTG